MKIKSDNLKMSLNSKYKLNSHWNISTKSIPYKKMTCALVHKLLTKSSSSQTKDPSNSKSKIKSFQTNCSKRKNNSFSSIRISITYESKPKTTKHKKNNSAIFIKIPSVNSDNPKETKIYKLKNYNKKKISGKNNVNLGETNQRKSLLSNNTKSPS